ncbi:MAG: hypothetical protein R3D55_06005 [Chloroflexota bacterium]
MLVALIGAMGGAEQSGVQSDDISAEAAEAPAEMLRQGAFPFFGSSSSGIIVGTAASGASGLIALPLCLAILGILLAGV